MITDIKMMDIRELQELIRTPASGNVVIDNILKCITAVDVLLEIEHIKKHKPGSSLLRILKEQKSKFHEACNKGYVQVAALDTNAVQNGLFEVGDDFFSAQFWQKVINGGTDPAYSVRLISLRSYDKNCGTQFHFEMIGY